MKMKKGSLTIELSLLMPLILGLFVVIIFTGFILHDKCIVNKACLSAALRGSQEADDKDAMEAANRAIAEIIPGHLLCKWTYDTGIDVGKDAVRVTFAGDAGIGPAGMILKGGSYSHGYSCVADRYDRAGYLREHKKDLATGGRSR